jgi:hypothetical protein
MKGVNCEQRSKLQLCTTEWNVTLHRRSILTKDDEENEECRQWAMNMFKQDPYAWIPVLCSKSLETNSFMPTRESPSVLAPFFLFLSLSLYPLSWPFFLNFPLCLVTYFLPLFGIRLFISFFISFLFSSLLCLFVRLFLSLFIQLSLFVSMLLSFLSFVCFFSPIFVCILVHLFFPYLFLRCSLLIYLLDSFFPYLLSSFIFVWFSSPILCFCLLLFFLFLAISYSLYLSLLICSS